MNNASKDSLIPLLNRLYEEIRGIEIERELWAAKDDYRPRIDLFHDAVRAYSSGVSPYEPRSRLSIEHLAYDLEVLAQIQTNPLRPMAGTVRQSSGTAVSTQNNMRASRANFQASRMARAELADRYKQYGVLFAALLAESADMNHNARAEERDMLVESLEQVKQGTMGLSAIDLRMLAGKVIDDPELAALVAAALPEGVLNQTQANQAINNAQNYMDHQKERLEQAHITWLSNQRMMYEEGKDIVKKLQQHGLQMAGKFLSDAIARSGPAAGRGF